MRLASENFSKDLFYKNVEVKTQYSSFFIKQSILNMKSYLSNNLNIAIIDDFSNIDIDLNNDGYSDFSHGNTVKEIITDNLKNASISNYNVAENGYIEGYKLLNSLKDLIKRAESGEKIDATNISLSANWYFNSNFEEIFPEINHENIASKATEILSFLKNSEISFYNEIAEIIDKINELSELGTKVFISGGNCYDSSANDSVPGSNCINILTLADKAIAVGALDTEGNIADWTSK